MDRPPEEPAPEGPAPEPVSPYGPGAAGDPVDVPQQPAAQPHEWQPPTEGDRIPDAAASVSYPPVPPAPGQIPQMPPGAGVVPAAKDDRPGIGPGIATGCGLQVLAFILFALTTGFIGTFFGLIWPFALVTVAAIALMFSRRWRRFATGALIVCAATWIIVIGPCIALLQPYA